MRYPDSLRLGRGAMYGQGERAFRIGEVTVDLEAGLILDAAGRPVTLHRQSFEVLRHLIAPNGRVVGKEKLISTVWPGIAVTDDSLVQCIHDIRRALGPAGQVILRTIPRQGYRVDPGTEGMIASRPVRAVSRRSTLAMAGIASIGVVAASLVQWRPTATPSLATALPVIAVMPFETRGAIEPDHLGASLAETIITMLSRAPQIMTIARRSSFSLRDKEGDVRTLGQTLQAGYLLEGSVWRDGDELHVSTRLDDTHSGRQVWAARFVERGKIPTPLLMP